MIRILGCSDEQAELIIGNAQKLVEEEGKKAPEVVLGRELTTDDNLMLNAPSMTPDLLVKLNGLGYYNLNHITKTDVEVLAQKLEVEPDTLHDLKKYAESVVL